MKKRDLIKHLRQIASSANMELEFLREGGNYEIWKLGGERFVIPRHREINEYTAEAIIKRAKEMTTQ